MHARPITKAEEIAKLEAVALELGAASYCGAWLLSIVGEVASNLASDFVPVMSLQDAARRAAAITAAAEAEAAAIRRRASEDAEKMRVAAMNARDGVKGRACAALRAALRDLESA